MKKINEDSIELKAVFDYHTLGDGNVLPNLTDESRRAWKIAGEFYTRCWFNPTAPFEIQRRIFQDMIAFCRIDIEVNMVMTRFAPKNTDGEKFLRELVKIRTQLKEVQKNPSEDIDSDDDIAILFTDKVHKLMMSFRDMTATEEFF